jgi:hypothetical protein
MFHSEVLILKDKLSRVNGLTGFNTKIAIRRNIARIETATKPLVDEEKEISEGVKDYRAEYNETNKKLSEGKVKMSIVQGRHMEVYDVPEAKQDQLKKELNELETKHKSAITTYETKIKSFQEFLKNTESSFKPIMIKMSQIEEFDQAISQENLDNIWALIIDDTQKEEEKVEEKTEETK